MESKTITNYFTLNFKYFLGQYLYLQYIHLHKFHKMSDLLNYIRSIIMNPYIYKSV